MTNVELYPVYYGQDVMLEFTRDRAVATVINSLCEEFPDLPPYAGPRVSQSDAYIMWQHYGNEYWHSGKRLMQQTLEHENHVESNHGTIARMLGELALEFADTERNLRAEAYAGMVDPEIVAHIELSKEQRATLRGRVVSSCYELFQFEPHYSIDTLSHVASEALLPHAMQRIPTETRILREQLRAQQELDIAS